MKREASKCFRVSRQFRKRIVRNDQTLKVKHQASLRPKKRSYYRTLWRKNKPAQTVRGSFRKKG